MNDENLNLEEKENIIFLEDEEGNEIPFEFVDVIEYGKEEYAILLPVNKELEDGAVILQIDQEEDSGEEVYYSVEDEAVLDAVFQLFQKKWKDMLNFLGG